MTLSRRSLRRCLSWCLAPLLLVAALRADAAPLEDRIPGQTLLYVGWTGGEATAEKIQDAPAGKLLAASNLPAVLDELLPRIADRIAEEDARAGEIFGDVVQVVQALQDKPGALFFGGIGENRFQPGEPAPRIGLLIDAGDDALEIRGRLETLFNDIDQPLLRALVKNDERYVMMSFGYGDLEFADAAAGNARLADNRAFREALDALGGAEDADAVLFADVPGLLGLIDDAVTRNNEPQAQRNWPILRDQLGLSDVRFAVASGGFADDGLWHSRGLLALEQRVGLFAVNEGGLDEAILQAIPKDAHFVQAAKFDVQRFLDTVKAVAVAIDPEADANIKQGMSFANLYVGRNLERDLFQQLGDDWAVYRSDSIASGLGGFVVVNKVQDERKLRTSLIMLGTALANGVRSQMDPNDPIEFNVRSAKIEGVDVYYLGTPGLSPAFAVANGYLFAALQPQSVAAAANAVADMDGSILDNPQFKEFALQYQQDGSELRGVQFFDSPQVAADSYAGLIAMARLLNGGADLFKVEPIDPILPTLPTLMKHLTPGGGVTYATEEGLRFETVATFPGSNGLFVQPAVQELMAANPALSLSILLPSLNRARETANRVKSASNLRQIGLGAILYANEQRNGAMPPTIGDILLTQDITADVFINPRTGNGLPGDFYQQAPRQQAQWVSEQGDYVWYGEGLNNAAPADVILAMERPAGLDDGVNVLYADGHVTFELFHSLDQAVERNNEIRRARDLPEIEVEW